MNCDQQVTPITNDGSAGAIFAPGRSSVSDALEPAGAAVIVNADDWGRDNATTDRCLDCFLLGAVSSVSAMVFMEDSERAAHLARHHGVDALLLGSSSGLVIQHQLSLQPALMPVKPGAGRMKTA